MGVWLLSAPGWVVLILDKRHVIMEGYRIKRGSVVKKVDE